MKKKDKKERKSKSPKWWLFGGTSGAILFGTLSAWLEKKQKKDQKKLNQKVQKLISAKRTFVLLISILLCCVVLTMCLLASRLERYFYSRSSDMEIDLLTNPGYQMDDGSGNEVFAANSKVTLFQASYENETGELTAFSSKGDHIVAPGTEGQYTIRLKNTGNVMVYFTFTLDGFFSTEGDHAIPICVRLKGVDGNYLIGGENEWTPIDQLSNISDTGSLDPKTTHLYTLEWKWPFESGSDALDTTLGSGTILGDAKADVNFTMAARTTAMVPADTRPVFTIISEYVFPVVLVVIIVLLIWATVTLIHYRKLEKKRALETAKEMPDDPIEPSDP